jgi:hypothetical protein|tara:strand:- start:162 stop:317 length:156 start_codon:yes stop_codon:yes gene_type:complete
MKYKPKEKNIIKLKQFLSICQSQNQKQEKNKESTFRDVLYKQVKNIKETKL